MIKKSFVFICMTVLLFLPACGQISEKDKALDFRKIVQEAKNKVFPAVVYIRVLTESHDRGKKVRYEVSGSGFIVSKDGEVVTNWHVVDKAVKVRCLLFNGKKYDAKVIGSDKDTDLALIKMDMKPEEYNLPVSEIGDSSKLIEGDFVMTMGAPFGMSRSVAMGIISCTNRYLEGNSEYSLWLQTDAAINPGNSGGPLVNTQGKVIGVNTLGITSGDNTGFSVPTGTIKHVISQIRQHGHVQWAYTGLTVQALNDFNRNVYFDFKEGVMVDGAEPDSPAFEAGFQPNDRILTINGIAVTAKSEEDLPKIRWMLGTLDKTKDSLVEVMRGKEKKILKLNPRVKGKVEGEEREYPRWDFTAKAINQFNDQDLYHYKKKGVFVYGIKSQGNARASLLQRQDIIQEIDGKKIFTVDDLSLAHAASLKNIEKEHKLFIQVLRNGELIQVVLDFQRDFEKE